MNPPHPEAREHYRTRFGDTRLADRLGQLRNLHLRDDYFCLCGASRSKSPFF